MEAGHHRPGSPSVNSSNLTWTPSQGRRLHSESDLSESLETVIIKIKDHENRWLFLWMEHTHPEICTCFSMDPVEYLEIIELELLALSKSPGTSIVAPNCICYLN